MEMLAEALVTDKIRELVIIEPNSKKLVIKESREISDEPTWAHLAISDRQIFVRELEAIACYEW